MYLREITKRSRMLLICACAMAIFCVSSGDLSPLAFAAESHPEKTVAGYLLSEELPNSLFLLPPPPSAESDAFSLDKAVSRMSLKLRGTPRWMLAIEDANLNFPQAAGAFSCAVNAPITEQETPRLYRLLQRVLIDAGRSTGEAKNHYRRTRPFVVNKMPTCTPDEEKRIALNGSYPSGHTTAGWTWALIISEIAPDRFDAILARGRAFGESRMICNVHWQSDVVEGRFMGAATVARLHANPAFRADLDAARSELAVIRSKGLKPVRDCAAESKAMAKQLE